MKKKFLRLLTITTLLLNTFVYGDAVLNKGHTFSTGDEVTATKLNNLVDNATVASINQNNIASGWGLVYTGASAPSDTDALWKDTGNSNILKYYNGATWTEVSTALVGSIVAYTSETEPSGYLECDGSAISRTTYSELFAIIGETFGEGDGSTTFNIPDIQGRFLRGWDNSAGTDPDAATRTAQATGGQTGDHVGSEQEDEIESHLHTVSYATQNVAGSDPSINTAQAGGSSKNSGLTGGNETRPKNVYIMYCIKY